MPHAMPSSLLPPLKPQKTKCRTWRGHTQFRRDHFGVASLTPVLLTHAPQRRVERHIADGGGGGFTVVVNIAVAVLTP